jgi:copper chaperone CopZ
MVPASVKMVSMKVEEMHCPFGCYPTVEKALAKVSGVSSVKLAEQKKEGTIDNPVVLVQVDSNFDPSAAIAALNKVGFASEMMK